MTRNLLRICAALFFLATASFVSAQGSAGSHFGIAGGATLPTEEAKDVYDTGYHGSVMINFNAPRSPVGLRIEGTYAKMKEKTFPARNGDVQIGAGTANIVLGPRGLPVRPYFIGGGGVYRLRFSESTALASFRDTQTKFGWNAGGGLSFPLGPAASMFVEARYTRVETDPNFVVGNHFSFVPLTVGFVF